MKIDEKCLQSVMEAIEEGANIFEPFQLCANDALPKGLKKYSWEQIVYHVRHCDGLNYLIGCSVLGNGAMIIVEDLSPKGHAHLKEIRSKGIIPTVASAWEDRKKDNIWALICAIGKGIISLIKKVSA